MENGSHFYEKFRKSTNLFCFYIITSKIKLVKPASLSFFLTDNML